MLRTRFLRVLGSCTDSSAKKYLSKLRMRKLYLYKYIYIYIYIYILILFTALTFEVCLLILI